MRKSDAQLLLLAGFLLVMQSCNRPTASQRLEQKTRELTEILYANVSKEEQNAEARQSELSTGVAAPAFLKEQMGPYTRQSFSYPQELTMAGETYITFKAQYAHSSGKIFDFSISDMGDTEILLENRRRRAANVEAFDNEEEKLVKIPYETKVIAGFYTYKKTEKTGYITLFLYDRYFIEIFSDAKQEIAEAEILALLVHLPYNEMK
jgi:hypothetical protein